MYRRPHLFLAVVSSLLLLGAIGNRTYGYYIFLRWTVFLSASLVAWVAWESRTQPAAFLFVVVAILFNPVVPVYLARSTWRPIDVVCAGLFAASLVLQRQQVSSRSTPGPY